jgi:hypothetical protein
LPLYASTEKGGADGNEDDHRLRNERQRIRRPRPAPSNGNSSRPADLQIYRDIKARDLTQVQAGEILGIKQPHVSLLMRNRVWELLGRATDGFPDGARARRGDGTVYPSHFSVVRTGRMPIETAYGISIRRFKGHEAHAKAQIIPNLALFGRPIKTGSMAVECVNRLVLTRIVYDGVFGPVEY